MLGSGQTAAYGYSRSGGGDRSSGHRLAAPPVNAHYLYPASFDEVGQYSLADADVTADLVELDPPFRDQAPDEPRLSPKAPRHLFHVQENRRRLSFVPGRHAALP